MQRSRWEISGNVAALTLVLIANGLANAVPLGGKTTGELSDQYPSLFTPAGYVFSIWALIYLLLLAFVVWQALPSQRSDAQLRRMQVPFLVGCGANAAWIFAWHYDLVVLSMALMLVLLASLVSIYRTLPRQTPPRQTLGAQSARHVCLVLPFSVYTAWISVATLANLSALQVHFGVQDWLLSEAVQTVLKMGLAAVIALIVLLRRRDVAFVAVVAWACIGILVKDPGITFSSHASADTAVQQER